jgi:hypothetical protein
MGWNERILVAKESIYFRFKESNPKELMKCVYNKEKQ